MGVGNCMIYIRREKESTNILIAFQDPLGSTDLAVIVWGVFDVWQTHVFSDSSLKPLNYCVCFLNLFFLIITGCRFLNLNILLKVLWPVCYSSYCISLSCLKKAENTDCRKLLLSCFGSRNPLFFGILMKKTTLLLGRQLTCNLP